MNKSSLLWIAVVASGCVFTDLKEIPQQIGLIPAEDSGVDSTIPDLSVADGGADVAVEDSGEDLSVVDMAVDSDPTQDAGGDAEVDMPMPVCWGPRTNLPSGNICENTPTSGRCKVVQQQGCPVDEKQVCAFVFNGNGVVPGCTDVQADCVYLRIGDPCLTRAGQVNRPLGTCEPGAYCPPGATLGNDTYCRWYCELGTGLGCEPSEVCQRIAMGGTDQTSAGYGVCEPDNLCVMPL